MSNQPTTPPSKREVMLALLEHAEAQVHLDARRTGVELPPKLRASSNVRLDYGYSLVPPIPDLVIEEGGIRATLSFNRSPFPTFIPWSAVFLIADFGGRGAVWREDLPPELIDHVDADTAPGAQHVKPGAAQPLRETIQELPLHAQEPAQGEDAAPAPAPRRLGVIDGDAAPSDEASAGGPPRPRPALRLVK